MVSAINATPDADFARVAATYVDLRRFVVQAAVENFLGDNDGLLGYAGMNNFYLYRFQAGQLSTFIPWDKSEAFKMRTHARHLVQHLRCALVVEEPVDGSRRSRSRSSAICTSTP